MDEKRRLQESDTSRMEDHKLGELARMAHRRRRARIPDTEHALEEFKALHRGVPQTVGGTKPQKRVLHLWGAALIGAAAMLVGCILYVNMTRHDIQVLAMKYDEMPQRIILSTAEGMQDLSGMDSVVVSDCLLASVATDGEGEEKGEPAETSRQTLSTPRGMDLKVTLQDGTEVWLDAESSLNFPSSFIHGERRVNLTGEAYFRVAKNEQHPFVVSVAGKEIKVLGTEFNVRSYSMENTQVALVKGSIELSDKGKEEVVLLSPGQGATWSDQDELVVHEVDTYSVVQWIDGLFYFDEASLAYVLRELGRWYNMGVLFHTNKHLDYKIHFSASRSSELQEIMAHLNTLCPFRIEVEENHIVVY